MKWKLIQILKKGGGGILHDDEALIAVNKPAGLLVIPDRYDRKLPNLYEMLGEIFGTIFIVHRIDKDTSGVVVFAKTADTHEKLNEAFEARRVEKIYRAIVTGIPHSDSGIIDLPISESHARDRRMWIDRRGGKEAFTEYKIVERLGNFALLEVKPRTGRTHQIRLHLSSIGLPILADPLYGDGEGFLLSSIKKNYRRNGEEIPLISRTALHAFSLTLTHPLTGKTLAFEAQMPKDMQAVLKAMRKYRM